MLNTGRGATGEVGSSAGFWSRIVGSGPPRRVSSSLIWSSSASLRGAARLVRRPAARAQALEHLVELVVQLLRAVLDDRVPEGVGQYLRLLARLALSR